MRVLIVSSFKIFPIHSVLSEDLGKLTPYPVLFLSKAGVQRTDTIKNKIDQLLANDDDIDIIGHGVGTWAKSDKEKIEIFGDHLSKVFEPSPSHNECEYIELLAYLETPGQLDLPISEFNVKDVKSIISKLSVKKAPGYDLITGNILKKLLLTGLKFLTQLFPKTVESCGNHFIAKAWQTSRKCNVVQTN